MPRIFLLTLLIAVLSVLNVASAEVKDAPQSAEQLRDAYEKALRKKDENAVVALINWKGVSKEMKEQLIDLIDVDSSNLVSVVLAPLEDEELVHERDGIRYSPNVEILGIIEVKYKEEDSETIRRKAYGRVGNAFYFPGVIEERIATPATKEKCLSIYVDGVSPDDSEDTFKGDFVVVKGGKEVKEEFSGKGNLSSVFWGDYIKSCSVQIISDKQSSIQLSITEDGAEIFKSKKITTRQPIVYEKQ